MDLNYLGFKKQFGGREGLPVMARTKWTPRGLYVQYMELWTGKCSEEHDAKTHMVGLYFLVKDKESQADNSFYFYCLLSLDFFKGSR